jgi:hypothetical protein
MCLSPLHQKAKPARRRSRPRHLQQLWPYGIGTSSFPTPSSNTLQFHHSCQGFQGSWQSEKKSQHRRLSSRHLLRRHMLRPVKEAEVWHRYGAAGIQKAEGKRKAEAMCRLLPCHTLKVFIRRQQQKISVGTVILKPEGLVCSYDLDTCCTLVNQDTGCQWQSPRACTANLNQSCLHRQTL